MKRFLTVVLTFALIMSVVLAGCSSKKGTDKTDGEKPAVNGEKPAVTLKITRRGFNDVHPASKDLWMWKKYEEKTGIHVDWEEIPDASIAERKNIILASNDLPEAFYQIGFSQSEISKYGKQGLFIPLDDLIENHAPNLKNLFKQFPDIKQALTMPDGKIYSLPYIDFSAAFASIRLYVNKNWLDELNLPVPQTTEEFANTLKAFKASDANRFGWYMPSGTLNWTLERQLMGSFGMGNGGLKAAENWIYKDKDGELKLVFNDPKYKEVWKYLNGLWEAGTLHPQTFTGSEYANWVADGSKDLVGSFSWAGPGYIGDKIKDNYVGINALEGPNGDKVLNWIDPPARGISSMMLTKANKHPEETIKWVDYFYGEEGSKFAFFGLEGETYNMVDGKPQYIDEIKNYEGGQQLGSFQYVDNVYGGYYPYLEPDDELRMAVQGITVADNIKADPEEARRLAPEEIWPSFAPTDEETTITDPIMTDINNYITEMRVKFIMGELNLDKDWDTYVATLDKMGAKKYLEVKRAQYARYQASK